MERDPYVDWLRAGSLIVVVIWHWAFTILQWTPSGPEPTSPIGFTSGLWIFTWLLQVLPLFFYVGGYVHLRAWQRAQERGVGLGAFVRRRLRQLIAPASLLLGTWIVLGMVAGNVFGVTWMWRAVLLVVSPLWFLAVYLLLIALLPVALWLHRKFDFTALVWLGGAAMLVDVLRFRYGLEGLGWLNMIFIWGLAHQAGFFYQRVVDLPRRYDFALVWVGLFGLLGLVFSGLYPGSMVGTAGDRFSNMAPPTFVIVALMLFQIGVAEVFRPTMERVLREGVWRWITQVITAFALPLFLFHTTGMALWRGIMWFLFGNLEDRLPPDLWWWIERPFAVIGPLACTLPVIVLFSWARGPRGVIRDRERPRIGPPPGAA